MREQFVMQNRLPALVDGLWQIDHARGQLAGDHALLATVCDGDRIRHAHLEWFKYGFSRVRVVKPKRLFIRFDH